MTPKSKTSNGGSRAAVAETNGSNPERERVFNAYRQWGYLEGDLDPLGFLRPRETPELELEGEYAREARAIYSSTIGVEINHIYSPERRRWIYEQMESPTQFEVTEEDQQRILDLLIRADVFEQVMQQRYLGSKRFSLEGVTALIPLVDEVLDTAAQRGAIELVMGMSHRGRLNVIAHVAQRPAAGNFRRIRRRRPAQRSRLRRREISHGRDRRIHNAQRRKSSHPPGLEPQPSRSRRSRHRRPHPRQARPHRRRRTRKISPAPGPRRRRVRRTRHPRRDHELRRPSRLHRRRHDSRHRQQSSRLYHQLHRRTLHALRRLHRAPPVDSHLPRQRRRRRRRRPRRPHGHRVPLQIRHRRRHRSDRLSPPRPQRSRRPHHHPAAALQEDQRASAALGNLRRRHRRHRRAVRKPPPSGRVRSRAETSRQHQAKAADARPARNIGTTTTAASTSPNTKSKPDSRPKNYPNSPLASPPIPTASTFIRK